MQPHRCWNCKQWIATVDCPICKKTPKDFGPTDKKDLNEHLRRMADA